MTVPRRQAAGSGLVEERMDVAGGMQERRSGRSAAQQGRITMHGACRYQREIAGTGVCWASTTPGIVIGSECGACEVPTVLDSVDCGYLQPRIEASSTRSPRWICGVTRDYLGDPTAPDAPCHECWRARSASGTSSRPEGS